MYFGSIRREVAELQLAMAWLARLFAELVLDLDGCALSFRRLRVAPAASEPELVLQLGVCVTSFPSLEINF